MWGEGGGGSLAHFGLTMVMPRGPATLETVTLSSVINILLVGLNHHAQLLQLTTAYSTT